MNLEWVPFLEIDGTPEDYRLLNDVEVDAQEGAARTCIFTLVKLDGEDPYKYIGLNVRFGYINTATSDLRILFTGFIREPNPDFNNGTITFNCSDIFEEAASSPNDALFNAVKAEGKYSIHVFGQPDSLSKNDQFKAYLSTTDKQLKVDPTGSVTLAPLVSPDASVIDYTYGEDKIILNTMQVTRAGGSSDYGLGGNADGSTDPFRPVDSFATDNASGSNAFGSSLVSPEMTLESAGGTPPVNEIITVVEFRFPRLCQRNYAFELNSLPNLGAQNGALVIGTRIPSKLAFEEAIEKGNLKLQFANYTEPPPSSTITDFEGKDRFWVITEELRKQLFMSAYVIASHRFTRMVTRKITRIVRCPESIARYGLNSRTETAAVQITGFDLNAWEENFNIKPTLNNLVIGEWSTDLKTLVGLPKSQNSSGADETKSDPDALITSDENDEAAAMLASDVLVAQAIRDIQVANGGLTSGANGAVQTATITFTTSIDEAPDDTGDRAKYDTTRWKATGTIINVKYKLGSNGAATADITLTSTLVPSGEYGGVNGSGTGGGSGGSGSGGSGGAGGSGSSGIGPGSNQVGPGNGNTPTTPPDAVDEPPNKAGSNTDGGPYYQNIPVWIYGVNKSDDIPEDSPGWYSPSTITSPVDTPFKQYDFKIYIPPVIGGDVSEIDSRTVEVHDVALVKDTFGI